MDLKGINTSQVIGPDYSLNARNGALASSKLAQIFKNLLEKESRWATGRQPVKFKILRKSNWWKVLYNYYAYITWKNSGNDRDQCNT